MNAADAEYLLNICLDEHCDHSKHTLEADLLSDWWTGEAHPEPYSCEVRGHKQKRGHVIHAASNSFKS